MTRPAVLLVEPPLGFEAAYPLGLAALAASLCRDGWRPVGVDLRLDRGGLAGALVRARPVAVVVNTSIRGVAAACGVMRAVRRGPGAPMVIAVGTASALDPGRFLAADLADVAVVGDAEAAVPALLAGPRAGVAGAAVRAPDGRVVAHPGGELPPEALPAADRAAFPLARYARHPMRPGRIHAALETSRGCARRCPHCPIPARHGGVHRARPVEAVVDEMRRLRWDHGVTSYWIEDEQPLGDRDRLARLLAAVRREVAGAVLELPNGIDPSLLDRELLTELAAAGARRIALGIESGDEGRRATLGRALATAELRERIELARRLGMVVTGYFLVGLPGETARERAATLAAARRLPLHHAHLSICWPWRPLLEAPTRPMRALRPLRIAGYLAAYGSPRRLADLAAAGELSASRLPAAAARLATWLAAGESGGGGW